MAGSFIPVGVHDQGSVWNIRGFVILSLFLHLLLASIAQMRKKSNNRFIIFTIWSAYFMADWAVAFTFRLISNARRNDSVNPPEVNETPLALSAAYLLIHLGGLYTITVFSLEVNVLWMRHLVELVAQLFSFLYIFLKTILNNNLVVATSRVTVAGLDSAGGRSESGQKLKKKKNLGRRRRRRDFS